MRTPLYIIGAAVLLLIWLVPTWLDVSSHASQLYASLDAVVEHYRQVGDAHAKGLADAAAGVEPDAAQTRALLDAFGAVGRASSFSEKLSSVAALQKRLGDFFTPGSSHVLGLSDDSHFIAMNQEITGRGKASLLVLEYNKAASVMREDLSVFPRNIFAAIRTGEPPLLFIDGRPKDIKVLM